MVMEHYRDWQITYVNICRHIWTYVLCGHKVPFWTYDTVCRHMLDLHGITVISRTYIIIYNYLSSSGIGHMSNNVYTMDIC